MANSTEFYRCSLDPTEDGLVLRTTVYKPVRETPLFYLCIREKEARIAYGMGYSFKQINDRFKVRRISKGRSRVAHPTVEEALSSLKIRKQRQIQHALREKEVASVFLDRVEDATPEPDKAVVIPGTEEVCRCNFVFD